MRAKTSLCFPDENFAALTGNRSVRAALLTRILQFVINSDLSVLSRWFRMNFLQINAAKTQAIAIGPSSYQYEFDLNDSNVHTKDTLKILGVVLDSKLTFKAHIKEQLNKACAKASALRRIRKFISKDVLVRFYMQGLCSPSPRVP